MTEPIYSDPCASVRQKDKDCHANLFNGISTKLRAGSGRGDSPAITAHRPALVNTPHLGQTVITTLCFHWRALKTETQK